MITLTACYNILEIHPKSGLKDIKSAYHRKAKYWHPDVNASPDAHAQFIRIREAYEKVLTDYYFRRYTYRHQPHPKCYPVNTRSSTSFYSNRQKPNRKAATDFTNTKQGRMICIFVHIVFALTGLLVFLNPLIVAVTKDFNTNTTLADSIVAISASMILGIVIAYFVIKSLYSSLHQFN